MSEFTSDEARDAHLNAMQAELEFARQWRPDDVADIEAEIKRLGGKPGEPAKKDKLVEHDGEFATDEQREKHVEALKAEYAQARTRGDKKHADEIKAELERLGGKPKKTREKLSVEDAAAAENDIEEARINPNSEAAQNAGE